MLTPPLMGRSAVITRVKRFVREQVLGRRHIATAANLDAQLQLELAREFDRLRRSLPSDNPAAHGFKVYSQADEDGIIERICDRLNVQAGAFVEIGCGNGLENNTHYLLLKDWRGVWVDGNKENIEYIGASFPLMTDRLRVVQAFVTRENVKGIIADARSGLGGPDHIDVLSVDIDGNDLQVTIACLEILSPALLIVEYNAKFPYPLAVGIAYDEKHQWNNDDYQGASLGAWTEVLNGRYKLICCNLAGTNAFFVRIDLSSAFGSSDPTLLYQPARFYLTALRSGHRPSLSFLAGRLLG